MHKPVTARLTALKLGLEDNRHGGLVLTGDDLEAFIQEIDELRGLTRQLENGSRMDFKRETLFAAEPADLRPLIDNRSATVLNAMRAPDSNVRLFPVVPRHHGGDTA